jgi:hypothetical protein
MARKKKYQPKLTAEEYEELTGQGLGSLVNQGTSVVNNTSEANERTESETSQEPTGNQSTSVINNTNTGRTITGTHG